MILDAEVLMVDNKTGKPLPFGSLGIHKGTGFKDAVPCLFVFDIMHYNGENLMDKPIKERRKILEKQMVEVGKTFRVARGRVKMADKKWTRLHEGGVGPLDTDPYSTVPSPRTGHAAGEPYADLWSRGPPRRQARPFCRRE